MNPIADSTARIRNAIGDRCWDGQLLVSISLCGSWWVLDILASASLLLGGRMPVLCPFLLLAITCALAGSYLLSCAAYETIITGGLCRVNGKARSIGLRFAYGTDRSLSGETAAWRPVTGPARLLVDTLNLW